MIKLLLIFPLLFIVLLQPSYGQYSSAQEEAIQRYTEGNYADALIKFKKLLTLFPNDPKYFYYTGVCMVQTNTTLETAVKHLTFASESAVPRDVYFFLGKAYHLQYKFADAIQFYLKFQQFGLPAEHEKLQLSMWIAQARAGQEIKAITGISIYEREQTDQENAFGLLNEKLKNGQFVNKTGKVFSLAENKSTNTWRFEPYLKENGVVVFGSSRGILKSSTEIYQVQYNGKQWGRQQMLPVIINTPYDEDFVWFDESEPALYFASEGHNSMGGFDIFKSVYSPDYKTWSKPINLGYPINSPYNDYLFVPDDNREFAWFASDRETSGDAVMFYKIKFEKEYSSSAVPAGFAFSNILTINAKVATEMVSPKKTPVKVEVKPMPKAEAKVVNKPVEYPKELMQSEGYNRVINDALTYQLKSDSLGRLIEDYREKLVEANQESEKSAIKTRIFQCDKLAKVYQVKADSLYTKARDYEKKTSPGNHQNSEVVTSGMAKQAFAGNKQEKKKSNASDKDNTSSVNSIVKADRKLVYEFKVMSKSPYKSLSEIPLDQPLPDGVIYRVQMGAFSKTIEPNRFNGIVPISGETVGKAGIIKYYAGLFSRLSDAEKALIKIKESGFKDAFVVAFFNGKPIPSNRAIELEKGYK